MWSAGGAAAPREVSRRVYAFDSASRTRSKTRAAAATPQGFQWVVPVSEATYLKDQWPRT